MPAAPKKPKRLARQQTLFLDTYARIGTISAGARAAGVTWRKAKGWTTSDPDFAPRFEEARAVFEDSLEERLMDLIEKGNAVTLRFKAQAEIPEKYGKLPHRPEPKTAQDVDAKWTELEQAAAQDDNRDAPSPDSDSPVEK